MVGPSFGRVAGLLGGWVSGWLGGWVPLFLPPPLPLHLLIPYSLVRPRRCIGGGGVMDS